MNYKDIVQETATKLNLLDSSGQLSRLDSLGIVNFVLALEKATSQRIPMKSVNFQTFASVDTVARVLEDLKGKGK